MLMAEVTSLANSREEKAIWSVLETVMDPEVPVLSVVDLGIVRGVKTDGDDVEVTITPTYSGCPAMTVIELDILTAMKRNGYPKTHVKTVFSPAWTTDWLSDAGREKLRAYGIAPPEKGGAGKLQSRISALLGEEQTAPCPHCGASDTKLVSAFGSTPCKSHYTCNICLEPFDHFKCH